MQDFLFQRFGQMWIFIFFLFLNTSLNDNNQYRREKVDLLFLWLLENKTLQLFCIRKDSIGHLFRQTPLRIRLVQLFIQLI